MLLALACQALSVFVVFSLVSEALERRFYLIQPNPDLPVHVTAAERLHPALKKLARACIALALLRLADERSGDEPAEQLETTQSQEGAVALARRIVMPELCWFEAFPPRGLSLAHLTGLVHVLAGRPHQGLRRLQPVVVFEVWLSKGGARWLVGCDDQLARHLPGELSAQLAGLSLVNLKDSPRAVAITAREVRPSSVAYPLRLDTAGAVAAGVLQARHRLAADEAAVLHWVVGPSHRRDQRPAQWSAMESLGLVATRQPESSERTAWREKVSEPLFGVRGRVGAVAADSKRGAQIIGPVVSAVSLAAGAHVSLASSRQSSRVAEQLFQVIGRSRTWSGIVNAAELAALLSWPVDGVTAPGADSAFVAPPRSLLIAADKPQKAGGDRIVGASTHARARGTLVRLPAASLASHVHVIAPTGAGKSTTLCRWLLSDIDAGRSIFLVEPKGDLVSDVLARIPARDQDRVRVVEPGSSGPVVGFNPLRGSRDDAERRADSLLGLFKAVFGSAIGPRSSDVLLHALIALSRLNDGTLIDIPVFLTNSGFRRRVLHAVSDPLTLAPWAAWFEALSEPERAQVVSPILNKTRVWTARPVLRRLLGQPNPSFRLDDLFREQAIFLVSLNESVLGPEATKLAGSMLLSQLREAVQRQATLSAQQRRPVSVVVDEWQTFTGNMDFSDMLATARGMNVGFTLAHQHLAQLSPQLRAAVLANTRSRLAYRPAQADAKSLADVLGGGITANDLLKLPAYHAAAQVLVDGAQSSPFVVSTPALPDAISDPATSRASSAARYGVAPDDLDAQLITRWQSGNNQGGGAIGTRKRGTNA